MLKKGILNPEMAHVLASTGHKDSIVVTDAGLPIPQNIERVDLALKPFVPEFLEVLDETLDALEVEKIILAEEIKTESPKMLEEILDRFSDEIDIEYVKHTDFKNETKNCRAAFRSGEFTPYANIILIAGVVY
jgi:D-ribose pyranase